MRPGNDVPPRFIMWLSRGCYGLVRACTGGQIWYLRKRGEARGGQGGWLAAAGAGGGGGGLAGGWAGWPGDDCGAGGGGQLPGGVPGQRQRAGGVLLVRLELQLHARDEGRDQPVGRAADRRQQPGGVRGQ